MRTILLVLLLAARAWAATPEELLEELKKRAPDKFLSVRENEDPASPLVALYGDLADANPDEADAMGDWLETYGVLLGFPDKGRIPAELLEPFEQGTGEGKSHLRLPFKDHRIWVGGTVGFHFDRDHKLVAVTGRYRPMGAVTPANLTGTQAIETAFQAIEVLGEVKISGDGLVYEYLAEQADGSLSPIYKLDLTVGDPPQAWSVTLGPTGELLCSKPGGETFDAPGKTRDGYPVIVDNVDQTLTRLSESIKGLRRWPLLGDLFEGDSSAYYHARSTRGHFDFPTTFVMTVDGQKRRLSHPRYLETGIYYHLSEAHDKAKALGAVEVDDPFEKDSLDIPVLRFDPWTRPKKKRESIDNAYYHHGSKKLYFGWYQPRHDFRHPAADPSVIYHEYGHYVHARLNPYANHSSTPQEIGDSGAISEGFGDWFSMLVSDGSTTGEYWLDQRYRRPTLNPDYCALLPIYDKGNKECSKFEGKTEIHMAGQLFSGLAVRLTSGASQLGKDQAESTARVFEALRIAVPTTFRSFALSAMAVAARYNDHARLPALFALWREAGLFKKCPGVP